MKAASLFYGDEVASALTEEDESDFLNELVRSVLLKEELIRVSGIFGVDNELTASPSGSPTSTSPMVLPVMTLDQWISQRDEVRTNQRRRKRVQSKEQQLLLSI